MHNKLRSDLEEKLGKNLTNESYKYKDLTGIYCVDMNNIDIRPVLKKHGNGKVDADIQIIELSDDKDGENRVLCEFTITDYSDDMIKKVEDSIKNTFSKSN